jgi:NADH-quinone oxidoreductase subunit L
MSNLPQLLWLVPCLPLLGAAIIAFLGKPLLRNQSHWPCVLGIAASCVVSLVVFASIHGETQKAHPAHSTENAEGEKAPSEGEHAAPLVIKTYYQWFQAGEFNVGLTLRADALTAMMLVMVTFIGTLIAVYSIGYMHHDPGYPRFFAEVSLFVFSMTLLVLGDNFFVLYAGWEGVGLCSYLLIGFWFQKPSAADAARKAFLVTRLGDVGLGIGILLLWVAFGYNLDYQHVFDTVRGQHDAGTLNVPVLTAACLFLFMGAAGKSAQFPFHVWLPDAMEGPTPVSALIHAATMVTAGVYLVARCTPLFQYAPDAQLVVACIGAFTALLAALIALTQTDLKRVLAYSTLSQLGYMFLALGCAVGSPGLATFAVIAAMFHLLTHAFFKALLFMSAGSVMHAMGGVIDMRRFSGLRKVLPTTHWTFLCGALALSGFPLLSGFWSKDEILGAAWLAGRQSGYGGVYMVLFAVGMLTAFLTAFYTFRAYFMTFWGEERVPEEAGHHAHESPSVMTVPLMILAVFAVGVGFVLGPALGSPFAHFIEQTPLMPGPALHEMNMTLMAVSSLVALFGIAVAYQMYVSQPSLPGQLARSFPGLYQLSLHKFYFDELYMYLIVNPAVDLARGAAWLDRWIVDGLVDFVGLLPDRIGQVFRPIQNGLVQFYALAMVLGLTVFILALIRPW